VNTRTTDSTGDTSDDAGGSWGSRSRISGAISAARARAVAGAAETAAAIRQSAEERMERRQIADFIIDLEKSDFIDSEGLETLLWLRRRCEELFGQVKLVGMEENVQKILEITRLEHRFECQKDLAAALKMMR
jgi:anti-anti-sigma factor